MTQSELYERVAQGQRQIRECITTVPAYFTGHCVEEGIWADRRCRLNGCSGSWKGITLNNALLMSIHLSEQGEEAVKLTIYRTQWKWNCLWSNKCKATINFIVIFGNEQRLQME